MVRIIRCFGINEFEHFGAKNFKLCRIDLFFSILEFKLLAHCQMHDFENPG